MKKIIQTMILVLISNIALADIIVNHSNKASPATVFAKVFEKAVGQKQSVNFFQAENCQQADEVFSMEKNAVMIYNVDVGIASLSKNLKCPVRAETNNTIFIAKSHVKVCTNASKPTALNQARTIGAASVIMSKGLINDWNSNGYKVKGVPYGGSKDVLQAVLSADVDLGYIGTGVAQPALDKGLIICYGDSNKKGNQYLGNKIKFKVDLFIGKIIYTNSRDPNFIKNLRQATQEPEFLAFLKKSGYTDIVPNVEASDLQEMKNHISNSYISYWKK